MSAETAKSLRVIRAVSAIAMILLGMVVAPRASADDHCRDGGPPAKAASKDVSDIYGQPATLWISDTVVGLTTPQGYSAAKVISASPLQRRAMLVDAQQDGNHQIIVDTGREAILYVVSGCRIYPAVEQTGEEFRFDVGHRRALGDGIGCSDLGDGRHLVQLLQLRDDQGRPLLAVRRTEIDLNGAWVTLGRSDTVTATSEQDPAWTTAADISCGDLTLTRDGVAAPY
ncbi:hypothetical protein [Mycobacterium sp. OAE908]|uniref:hypothetical protein n=1 Tax=Mycobacterium sp. OAE908 TaxID=2817899 RepID=UPI001AE2ACC4